jgi:hypothetical protein
MECPICLHHFWKTKNAACCPHHVGIAFINYVSKGGLNTHRNAQCVNDRLWYYVRIVLRDQYDNIYEKCV